MILFLYITYTHNRIRRPSSEMASAIFSRFPLKLKHFRSKTTGENYNRILQPAGKMEPICTVGYITGSACHQNTYVIGTNVSELSGLEMATREIILWRSGLSILNINATICSHHKYIVYKRFPMQEKRCCNPFSLHKSTRRGSIVYFYKILHNRIHLQFI